MRTKAPARVAATALLCAALWRLHRAALAGSGDFAVFWRAGTNAWSGVNAYLAPTPDKGFVFKYPPWTLPLFLPIAAFSLETAKSLWVGIEALSLAYCVLWLIRNGVRKSVALWTLALFWYLWFEHFMYGQIMLPLLAVALWAMDRSRLTLAFPASVLEYALSLKVFTLFALPGAGRRALWGRTLLGAFALLLAFHGVLVALALRTGHSPLREIALDYRAWIASAASGASELGPDVVRGAFNHGFPAAILRRIDPLALHPSWDAPISLLIAAVLGATLWRKSKALRTEERWSLWLALAVVAHPLAWQHSFVWVFPLAAYSLEANIGDTRASTFKNPGFWLSLLGIGLMALWVPQVVNAWAKPVELWGSKSWGAVLCAAALVWGRGARGKSLQRDRHSLPSEEYKAQTESSG